MPKSRTPKASNTRKRRRALARSPRRTNARASHAGNDNKKGAPANRRNTEYACVVEEGRTTYVLVPLAEYEELVKADMVGRAIAQIESGDDDFVDAYDLGLELAVERIVEARKAKGLTQKQLGEKLGLPQSQISRIERNPDRTTVRTLKRIARALGVDVSALIAGI